ncbi:MAG: NAD-dependent deacetylase [Candidatus Glassbacteria bacterium]
MEAIEKTSERIGSCRSLTVLTGAGISAESGIPTFRDAQEGLWSRYNPQELATREGFRANPRLVWEWYTYRRDLVKKASPNQGHISLARLENIIANFSLITQNIDGLHLQAGSKNIIELHGNIHRNKCFDEDRVMESWDESTIPPRCSCGSYIRPDVVWFGEPLPEGAIKEAKRLSREAEVMMVVGTSGLVQPAASLPFIALDGGAWVVEINPQPTPLSEQAHAYIAGKAGIVLKEITDRVEEIRRHSSRQDWT